MAGFAGLSSATLAVRVVARGRRVFFSLASELPRAEDGVSASDLEERAMSWDSGRRTAGTLCVRREVPNEVSSRHKGVGQTIHLSLEERGRALIPQDKVG